MNNNEIQNVNNYNSTIIENDIEIYIKYINIIIQYLLLGIQKIKNNNVEYVKYIMIKGLYTISYVFNILLKYTCNLDLTYHHCQKSYSYYIEFIGQIGDDTITYLQLNSKDAALFVYKKTIFEIPEEIKKKYIETVTNDVKYESISLLIDLFNKLIVTEISQLNSEELKDVECINKMYTNIGRVNSKIIKLYYSCMHIDNNNEGINNDEKYIKNNKLFIKKIKHVKIFCDIIILKKTNTETGVNYYKEYLKVIEYFIKKIKKTNNLQKKFEIILTGKYFSEKFEEKIKSFTILKFINWIFSNALVICDKGDNECE